MPSSCASVVESDALSVADPVADSDRKRFLDQVDSNSELSVDGEVPDVSSSSDELSVCSEEYEALASIIIVKTWQRPPLMTRAVSV